MMSVKICGITSYEDAMMAINCGASAIGIIFYKHSPRYVDPEKIFDWIDCLPDNIKKIGVFVDEELGVVRSISEQLALDYIQLHGNESPLYCLDIKRPIIKAVSVDSNLDKFVFAEYDVFAFLLDNYEKNIIGGTGKCFDWTLVSKLNINIPIILSGGLNASNILEGIKLINPTAVDINSGVESSPGKKDKKKMENIFSVIKTTTNNLNLFNN